MHYNWDFGVVWEYRTALLGGLLVSLALTGAAIVAGTLLAVPLALGLVSSRPAIRTPTTITVQVIRSIPLLVALVFAYYLIPVLWGSKLPAFYTAAAVFSVNLAVFAADVLRGGITAIPREHIEAAMALGMDRWNVVRRIILPETFRRSIPSLTALYISLFKYSSLASVISVSELLRVSELIIVERFKPLELYLAVAALYVAVAVPLSYAARWVERHPRFSVAPGDAR